MSHRFENDFVSAILVLSSSGYDISVYMVVAKRFLLEFGV